MRNEELEMQERLICALDVTDIDVAKKIVQELDGVVSFFKIGFVLYLTSGLELVNWLIENNKKVFLDLKLYDVPETVEQAVRHVAKLGVDFLTIHGNGEIIKVAVRGRGDSQLKLLSVTVLTSLDKDDLIDLGFSCTVEELVLRRANKAFEYGCNGVIASGNEVDLIKRETDGGLLVVSPGIRLPNGMRDDHKRPATPSNAIKAGADYLVVGRPIVNSPNKREAALRIIEQMQSAEVVPA